MEEMPIKVWDAHVNECESGGKKEKDIKWKEFKECMPQRYDYADTVAQSRQKLDKVFQEVKNVENYIERLISLLSNVEVEYE